jgi:hypothetical protein
MKTHLKLLSLKFLSCLVLRIVELLSPYFGRAKSGPRSKMGLRDSYGKLADRILYECLGPVRPCKL